MIDRKEKKKALNFLKKVVLKNRGNYIKIAIYMFLISGFLVFSAFCYKMIFDAIFKLNKILVWISIYFLTNIIMYLLKIRLSYINKVTSNHIEIDLEGELFVKMLDFSGKSLVNYDAGELMTLLYNDVLKIAEILSDYFFSFVFSIVKALGMFIFLLYIRWDLLLLIIIMQPIANIVQKKMRKKNEKISNYNRENLSELFSAIKEYTTNLSDIIALGIGNYIYSKFNAILQRQKKSETHICVNSTINESILDLFFLLPVCIILIAGGVEINNNALTIGGLLLFIQYSGQLYEPFTMIYEALYSYSSVLPSICRVQNFMENIDFSVGKGKARINGRIEINNMSFSYDNSKKIFENVSMLFLPRNVYAIFGESGCGKSTLCKILLGLWDIDRGCIYIDGIDIKEYDKEYLRKNITYISQDCFLFNDSIYNNIVLGEKEVSDQKFIEILKKVGLVEVIQQLPHKEKTCVGEKGVKFSGGQKQKIALARALIRHTPIVILDEPTSGLDLKNEELVIDCLLNELSDSTLIIISHTDNVINKCTIGYKIENRQIELMKIRN